MIPSFYLRIYDKNKQKVTLNRYITSEELAKKLYQEQVKKYLQTEASKERLRRYYEKKKANGYLPLYIENGAEIKELAKQKKKLEKKLEKLTNPQENNKKVN